MPTTHVSGKGEQPPGARGDKVPVKVKLAHIKRALGRVIFADNNPQFSFGSIWPCADYETHQMLPPAAQAIHYEVIGVRNLMKMD